MAQYTCWPRRRAAATFSCSVFVAGGAMMCLLLLLIALASQPQPVLGALVSTAGNDAAYVSAAAEDSAVNPLGRRDSDEATATAAAAADIARPAYNVIAAVGADAEAGGVTDSVGGGGGGGIAAATGDNGPRKIKLEVPRRALSWLGGTTTVTVTTPRLQYTKKWTWG